MRVYSDEAMRAGERLELDLQLPDRSVMRLWARVAWVDQLPAGEYAEYDIGLQFVDIAEGDIPHLASVLTR
jgi:hypothetical protein